MNARIARNIMSREATKFKNIILKLIDHNGYLPYPDDLDRFSPIDYHGVAYGYSNRIQLYYESLDRNYTSRVYINGRDLGSLDIHKGREWAKKNGIPVNTYKYKVEKIHLNDDEKVTFNQIVKGGCENIYNISVIPEINEDFVEHKLVRYDPEKLLGFIKSFTKVLNQGIVESNEFGYDREEHAIYVRPQESGESIYDYLFRYVKVLMESTGKLYRHEHQRRAYAKKEMTPDEIRRRISFEEMMTTNFATFIYLANFGIDISKLSDDIKKMKNQVTLEYLVKHLKKANECLFHYANDAQAAVFTLKKYHDWIPNDGNDKVVTNDDTRRSLRD